MHYISAEAVRVAVQRRASFNAIHWDTMQKVDLLILGDGLRRQQVAVADTVLRVGARRIRFFESCVVPSAGREA